MLATVEVGNAPRGEVWRRAADPSGVTQSAGDAMNVSSRCGSLDGGTCGPDERFEKPFDAPGCFSSQSEVKFAPCGQR